jgi:hypothetical protein
MGFFPSPLRPDQLWGSSSQAGVNRLGFDDNHSPPPVTEIDASSWRGA